MKYSLPTTASAPFCPSAVSHSVAVPADASPLRKLALFVGPGLLVSVGSGTSPWGRVSFPAVSSFRQV